MNICRIRIQITNMNIFTSIYTDHSTYSWYLRKMETFLSGVVSVGKKEGSKPLWYNKTGDLVAMEEWHVQDHVAAVRAHTIIVTTTV